MKQKLIFILFLSITEFCFAQKQNRVWIFGDSTGIDFNNLTSPIPINSASYHNGELYSSLADHNGNLVLYCNGPFNYTETNYGITFYNSQNQLIQNGDSLKGHISLSSGIEKSL